ncbi:MAG: phosphate/phosphite/phosphonate ABC transporter substrate-binding protein [Candidatus Eremiobacteraeota bacterium]|nr:phosphate/phosphite/phosphonate ABC transporter substrate-binding protein [Candidatus Eremiobacteraeota bacterium]MBV8354582.1 phosphate/phosphite/phosphonate ABC transporter substrate-binding protein [Candidatus Eremiobacteraeota bacterium]
MSLEVSRRAALAAAAGLPFALGRSALAAGAALRIGMIPDAGATQVSIDEKAPLRDYLSTKLSRPVELVIPTNYNATVEGLGNGSLDFAYLGGLTYLKARAAYGVIPLVQRTGDRQFHSLFITQTGSAINTLADLRGKRFAFGDVSSTSGHLMPDYALRRAGVDPDKDLSVRFTGNHPATAKAVESGSVDAGALDESVYKALIDGGQIDKTKVRVFFTTPPFVDYVWVARKDTPAADRDGFANAFLSLHDPADAKILAILRGSSFVRANDAEYETLRSIAQQLKLL